ncbi:MAG: hypothetical protein V3S64_00845 [bacterium]
METVEFFYAGPFPAASGEKSWQFDASPLAARPLTWKMEKMKLRDRSHT